MVDQIAVVTFTTPASTGTFSVTSPLITETFNCAILLYSHTTAEDSLSSGGAVGVGFVSTEAGGAADTDASSTVSLQDNRNTTTQAFQDESGGTGECIRSSDPGVATEVVAVFSSVVAGGVELNFTTTTVQVKCTAILFAGLSRSSIGNCTFLDSGSHEDVGNATPGFYQPDLLVFLSSDTSLDGAVNNGQPKIGFATRLPTLQQVSAYINIDRASDPTAADGYYRTDAATSAFTGDRTVQMDRIVITSIDSTGFNGIAAIASQSPQANYLALKFSGNVRMACAHLSVAGATGIQNFNTFGFTPDVVFGMSHLMTTPDAIDGTEADVCSAGYFITGRRGSYGVSVHHDFGHTIAIGTESDANTRQGAHAVVLLSGLGALLQEAEWVGGNSQGGFALNFTTAGQAGTLTALGLQIIPTQPIPRRRRKLLPKRSRMRRRRTRPYGVVKAVSGTIRLWRALGRIRRAMQRRLGWRPRFVPGTPTVPQSVFGQEVNGTIYAAGAVRGEVGSGGAEAGRVF